MHERTLKLLKVRRNAIVLPMVCLLALVVGCAARPKTRVVEKLPTTRPVVTGRPVLEISRGGAGLPLDNPASLTSSNELLKDLLASYEKRLILPDAHSPVTLVGNNPRRLDRLQVNLSDAVIRDKYRPSQFNAPGKLEPALSVREFEYVAWPLYYQKVPTCWRLSASDARFGLLRDPGGRQTLVLTEAREGNFEFQVKLADLKPMMLRGAAANPRTGFGVQDVDVTLSSDNSRSLTVDMLVKAAILYVPTTVRLHARADVDEWCNVRLTQLSCQGMDPGGVLLAGVLAGTIEKYEGKLMPLARWPDNRIVLTDVQFTLDDSLNITGQFEAAPPQDGQP
jgi:hypothetical protein